jgi:hypothetical protein
VSWEGDAAAIAADSVDLELVLLADASRSIDAAEIRFQREGYASAITHPEVLDAIAQGFEQRIAVTYVEWGEASSQDIVVPRTVVDDSESAAAFADALLQAPRRAFGPNAIGNALAAAHALIDSQRVRRLSQGDRFLRGQRLQLRRHARGRGARCGARGRNRDQRSRHSLPRQ